MYASDPEDNSQEHGHEFAELVIVEEGHGLHVINGRPLYIQQGDVFYVQPGDVHYYDELGTLKLINVLIQSGGGLWLFTADGGIAAAIIRAARRLLWLASAGDSQLLPGTGGKDIFPALRAADNTPLRSLSFPAGDHHSHSRVGSRI